LNRRYRQSLSKEILVGQTSEETILAHAAAERNSKNVMGQVRFDIPPILTKLSKQEMKG
jgi:hypothetical protein